MIATPTNTKVKGNLTVSTQAISNVKHISHSMLLPKRPILHAVKAGLNPISDAACYLFSILSKIKQLKSCRPLVNLQKELIQEINRFEENVKHLGYSNEYLIVCRYILCATFDDIISNTPWGNVGQWDHFSLLKAFDQDPHHQKKFFIIMERTIKEPSLYIDMMELMYLCLSMGYKGQYRATEHSQVQLELVTNNLYKYIRTFRGDISKTLSPVPFRLDRKAIRQKKSQTSPFYIFFVTVSVIMIIFISLGYLMDVISNEIYKDIFPRNNSVSSQTLNT